MGFSLEREEDRNFEMVADTMLVATIILTCRVVGAIWVFGDHFVPSC